jgi:hypothetical protein
MRDEQATYIDLPNDGRLTVRKTAAGAHLESTDADGRFCGSLLAREHCTLARLLRHGGTRMFGEYPVAVCVDGGGWLLSHNITIPLPRDAALLAANALDPEPDHLSPTGVNPRRDWPAQGYGHHETGSIYAGDHDRFVVSLIMGSADTEASTPQEAARTALQYTRSEHGDNATWFVYDRRTGRRHQLAQRQFAAASQ